MEGRSGLWRGALGTTGARKSFFRRSIFLSRRKSVVVQMPKLQVELRASNCLQAVNELEVALFRIPL